MNAQKPTDQSLDMMLRALKLPTINGSHAEVAIQAEREGLSFGKFLHHLCELELNARESRKIERLQKQSGLDRDKTLETFAPVDSHSDSQLRVDS